MTYNVFSGALNPTQSQSLEKVLEFFSISLHHNTIYVLNTISIIISCLLCHIV